MAHEVFISHSSKDKEIAGAAQEVLEAHGVRCWLAPRDILPGSEWGEAIIEAIEACRVVLLIFSRNANDSPQVRREVERAASKDIPIVPLRIEPVLPTKALEYFIGHVHWLDAIDPPLGYHISRIPEVIRSLFKGREAPAPRLAETSTSQEAARRPHVARTGASKSSSSTRSRIDRAQGASSEMQVARDLFGQVGGAQDSVPIKPLDTLRLQPARPHANPRKPTRRMASALVAATLATENELAPSTTLSRVFKVDGHLYALENGVVQDMLRAGMISLLPGTSRPEDEKFVVTQAGFETVVSLFGRERLREMGVLKFPAI